MISELYIDLNLIQTLHTDMYMCVFIHINHKIIAINFITNDILKALTYKLEFKMLSSGKDLIRESFQTAHFLCIWSYWKILHTTAILSLFSFLSWVRIADSFLPEFLVTNVYSQLTPVCQASVQLLGSTFRKWKEIYSKEIVLFINVNQLRSEYHLSLWL